MCGLAGPGAGGGGGARGASVCPRRGWARRARSLRGCRGGQAAGPGRWVLARLRGGRRLPAAGPGSSVAEGGAAHRWNAVGAAPGRAFSWNTVAERPSAAPLWRGRSCLVGNSMVPDVAAPGRAGAPLPPCLSMAAFRGEGPPPGAPRACVSRARRPPAEAAVPVAGGERRRLPALAAPPVRR